MANFYGQVCNFLSSLYEDGFPIFPITQVFFLSIIYWISSVLDESGNSGEESKSQKVCFYIIITVFLVFDCFLFWLNPEETREWISAIGLPITTFIVAYFINKRQKDREIQEQQREKNREDSNRKQEILKNYLSEMSGLLKDQDLDSIQLNSSVANLCKAFTISTLLELDSERNRLVTEFLTQMGITKANKNKWGVLQDTYLKRANLKGANFEGANLRETNLNGSNLEEANLIRASANNLWNAILSGTNLKEANLWNANFKGTDLSLTRNLQQAQIEEANGDETTRLPDYLKMPEHWKNSADNQDNVESYDEKTNLF